MPSGDLKDGGASSQGTARGATGRPEAADRGGTQPTARTAPKERTETSVAVVEARYDAQLRRAVTPWLGTPYRFGGSTRGRGTDCSGFSKALVFEGFSVNLPRVSRDQFRVGTKVDRENLRAGDLVFFDTVDGGRVNHVGIYQGEGMFAHASSSQGVVYAELGARYFLHAYRGARRILWYPGQD
ncbi:MAG: C40 family peptidase [Deltaproteobacteria bacterium]|nr:C40 family peptidase [Deltaproteobacteria bacterium]